jgi:cytochrome c oxidase assembly protein subunit 15
MKKLLTLSLCLAFCVILMGAYTRLADAGLSCPDWPNCYGFATVSQAQAHHSIAESAYPERPLEVNKAWLEMIHRYIAGTLGLFILAMVVYDFIQDRRLKILPMTLLGLVGLQVMLGMWTVTMNLMPLVVTGHLLGGFGIFSLLWLWRLSYTQPPQGSWSSTMETIKPYALLAATAVFLQIILGGWMASNYAATACTVLPICEGSWWLNLQWSQAWLGFLGEHMNYEFGVLDYAARMTIHVMHRFGAFAVLGCVLLLVWRLRRVQYSTPLTGYILGLLFVQLSLGISHVFFQFPVSIGVAHNATAVLLFVSCLTLWNRVSVIKEDACNYPHPSKC